MLDEFALNITTPAAAPSRNALWQNKMLLKAKGYRELASRVAGCTFNRGLYRFHDGTSGPQALDLIERAFPELKGTVTPFGFDWLGRQFVLDDKRKSRREPLCALVEPGTGEMLELPTTFSVLHSAELIEDPDAYLALVAFEEWIINQQDVPFDKCVGYRTPLFLGGSDDETNLELIDTSVYWTLSGQLRLAAIRNAPDARFSRFSIG